MPSHFETFLRKLTALFGSIAPRKSAFTFDRLQVLALYGTLAFGAFWVLYVIFSVAGNPPMGADAAQSEVIYLEDFEIWDRPKEVAAFTIKTASGEQVSLDHFEGRAVLLNIWATWCAPCVEEMPALDRLQTAFSDQPFEVVAVSIDRGGIPKIDDFYERFSISSLQAYSDQTLKISRDVGDGTLPVSVLIGADGREVGRMSGPAEWDGEPAKRLIRKLLRDGRLR